MQLVSAEQSVVAYVAATRGSKCLRVAHVQICVLPLRTCIAFPSPMTAALDFCVNQVLPCPLFRKDLIVSALGPLAALGPLVSGSSGLTEFHRHMFLPTPVPHPRAMQLHVQDVTSTGSVTKELAQGPNEQDWPPFITPASLQLHVTFCMSSRPDRL